MTYADSSSKADRSSSQPRCGASLPILSNNLLYGFKAARSAHRAQARPPAGPAAP